MRSTIAGIAMLVGLFSSTTALMAQTSYNNRASSSDALPALPHYPVYWLAKVEVRGEQAYYRLLTIKSQYSIQEDDYDSNAKHTITYKGRTTWSHGVLTIKFTDGAEEKAILSYINPICLRYTIVEPSMENGRVGQQILLSRVILQETQAPRASTPNFDADPMPMPDAVGYGVPGTYYTPLGIELLRAWYSRQPYISDAERDRRIKDAQDRAANIHEQEQFHTKQVYGNPFQ